MKKLKMLLLFAVAVVLVSLLASATSAHNQSTGFDVENVGVGVNANVRWRIYEHANTPNNHPHWRNHTQAITVNWGDFGTGHAFRNNIDTAVSTWNNQNFNGSSLLNMSTNNSGAVVFRNKNASQFVASLGEDYRNVWGAVRTDTATTVVAGDGNNNHRHYSTASNSVEIWINWNEKMVNQSSNARTWLALHELGHVIGLDHLATDTNGTHVMITGYTPSTSFPTTPSLKDIQAASAILGQHTHYYSANTNPAICTICNGSAVAYPVNYNANANGGAVTNMPSQQAKIRNVSLTLRSNIPQRSGYTFGGWGRTPTSTSSINSPGGTYTENEPYTYYAIWNPIIITFNSNSGTAVNPNTRQTNSSGQLTGTLPTPTRTGYSFDGWYTKKIGGVRVVSNSTVFELNTTIYARWVANQLPADGLYYIQGVGSGLNLRVLNGNNGATPELASESDSNALGTLFYFTHLGNGEYKISNMQNMLRYLEVVNSLHENEAKVQMYNWEDGYNTKIWILEQHNDGGFVFVNKNSGKVLDVQWNGTTPGTKVWQYTRNNASTAQRFKIIPP